MAAIEVPLSQGRVALIDDADAELVLGHRWYMQSHHGNRYAMRRVRNGGQRAVQPLHRLLTGWPLVDHINGNGLDNRRANLREATHAENMRNRRMSRNNTSGFKGVVLEGSRWRARIRFDRQRVSLGAFATAEEAANAYDAAARELHGEFAALNFPLDGERGAR